MASDIPNAVGDPIDSMAAGCLSHATIECDHCNEQVASCGLSALFPLATSLWTMVRRGA